MKIQCDVCDKEEANVFCTADDAALCHGCDARVHRANKLASKHTRVSLLQPANKECPRCDICQEKRALLFCQEDRALLCRECDIPIHKANEHTKKHNRFLLTGARLSTSSSHQLASPSSSGTTAPRPEANFPVTSQAMPMNNSTWYMSESTSFNDGSNQCVSQEGNSASTSSISEYLIETLPGWHVEDLMDPSSSYGFYETYNQMSDQMEGYRR